MGSGGVVYRSAESKTQKQAQCYLQTHQAPHRYLAYRDIPEFIRRFVKGKRALDYGAGTGASTAFLRDLGFEAIGIDTSQNMLEKARINFPATQFYTAESLSPAADFDLVFSSFVLFELASKEDIIQYLDKSISFLKEGGIFIGITGSEHLYSLFREWMTFNASFSENIHLKSGDVAKLALKHPKMEFYDYFWKKSDYLDCFGKTCLKILQVHSPLGFPEEAYCWKDELIYSPFTVFVAVKTKDKSAI